MENPSDRVVQELRRAERLMSAFMSAHPQSSHNSSLSEPIYIPEQDRNKPRGRSSNVIIVIASNCNECSNYGKIYSNVTERSKSRSFKAVSRNSIPQFLDSERSFVMLVNFNRS